MCNVDTWKYGWQFACGHDASLLNCESCMYHFASSCSLIRISGIARSFYLDTNNATCYSPASVLSSQRNNVPPSVLVSIFCEPGLAGHPHLLCNLFWKRTLAASDIRVFFMVSISYLLLKHWCQCWVHWMELEALKNSREKHPLSLSFLIQYPPLDSCGLRHCSLHTSLKGPYPSIQLE